MAAMTASAARLRDHIRVLRDRELEPEDFIVGVGHALREVVPFDAWALLTADPETFLPTGGVVEGFPSGMCHTAWDNELLDPDFNKLNALARSHDPVATLADVTDGELERSPRYRRLYRPMGWVDELRGAFRIGSSYWGHLLLVRDGSYGTFDRTEVQLIHEQVPQIAHGLRESVIRSSRIATQYPPAVLVLAADGSIEWLSDGAEAWVDDLATEGGTVGLPTVITIASARAASGRATRASIRGRGRSGRWFIVDAAPLQAGAEAQRAVERGNGGGPHPKLAVTIRPAQSSELLSILLERYELTDRELDIVLGLARGHATKEIADQLHLSAHTVRDHIKAIFTKVNVNSRGELVGKLFSEHLLEAEERRR
jgi:DNA-binding NarL/FixJ family response regulator